MKHLVAIVLALLGLTVACLVPSSPASDARSVLTEDSGLVEVTILAKGLE